MGKKRWNFVDTARLHSSNAIDVLRSHQGFGAILGRFFSSSIPPSFVSGRCAVLFYKRAGV